MGKKSTQAKSHVWNILSDNKGPHSEKHLTSLVQAENSNLKKRHVQKALKKLLIKGVVFQDDEDCYQIASSPSTITISKSTNGKKSEQEDADHDNLEAIPFAERMRREKAASTAEKPLEQKKKTIHFSDSNEPETDEDLDDKIRQLEEELANDVDDEDKEDQDDSSMEEDGEDSHPSDDERDIPILSLSALADDRIEALPTSLLPQAPTKKRSFHPEDDDGTPKSKKRSKIKKREKDNELEVSDGLRAAVKEVLSGYVARSSEKLPFYCRFCAKQYDNEEQFVAHKTESSFHTTAVAMEKKASYCKLCHKQLTSPAQMKEHLQSRPHKERLATVRQHQQGGRVVPSVTANGGREWKQGNTTVAAQRRR
jgi:hypothetical protein